MQCVQEMRRWLDDDGEWRQTAIWHVLGAGWNPAGDNDFARIACHTEDKIVFPGWPEEREPTCPDCVSLRCKAPR